MDDYKSLSLNFDSISWKHPRPVIYFLGPFFAKLGISGFYCLVLAGIIASASIVLIFMEDFFTVNLANRWIFFYGILLFSFPFILFASKFLGFIINLCAVLFGTSSLIFLQKAHRTNLTSNYLTAALLYFITLYTKEDFILPNFILIFYCFFLDSFVIANHSTQRPYLTRNYAKTKMILFFIYSLLAVLSLILFNKFIAISPFTSGGENHNPYAINLHPLSILKISAKYLTCHLYLSLIFIWAFFLSLFSSWQDKTAKKIFVIWVMIFSLVLPYAILPNHFTLFYIYNWLPWEIALISICFMQTISKKSLKFQLFWMIILGVLFASISFEHRYHNAKMYEKQAEINQNIIHTLKIYQPILNQQTKPIGVMGKGVEGFSPWRGSQGEYIKNNLKINAKWIVFTLTHLEETQNHFNPTLTINTLGIQKINDFKKIPMLYFDENGHGKFFPDPLKLSLD